MANTVHTVTCTSIQSGRESWLVDTAATQFRDSHHGGQGANARSDGDL